MVRVETSASTVSGSRLGRATGGDGTFFLALDGGACAKAGQSWNTGTTKPADAAPRTSIRIITARFMNHLLAVLLAVTAVAFWDRHLHWTLLFLPLYTGLLGTLAVGIGWVFASLQVYLRDTAQGVMVLLTLWFWVTPIFINEEQIPEGMRFLLRGNPLSLFVKAYRARLLSSELPNPEELAVMAMWSVGAFVAGGLFFRYLKRGFADVL